MNIEHAHNTWLGSSESLKLPWTESLELPWKTELELDCSTRVGFVREDGAKAKAEATLVRSALTVDWGSVGGAVGAGVCCSFGGIIGCIIGAGGADLGDSDGFGLGP